MPVLPDLAPDGNEADADADISEHVDRALHRVGDREIGVFVLVEPADEQNAAGEPDQLDQALNESEVADESGALERLPNHRHRRFIQKRPCKRAEETHCVSRSALHDREGSAHDAKCTRFALPNLKGDRYWHLNDGENIHPLIHSGTDRLDTADRASLHRSREKRAHSAQDRKRKPDREHEGPHGAGHDRGGGEGWPAEERRKCRRVHRWQHRGFAGLDLRGQEIRAPHRDFRRVQSPETRSHAGARAPS